MFWTVMCERSITCVKYTIALWFCIARLLIFLGLQKRLRENRNLFRLFSFWQWILFIGFNELMEEKKVVQVPFERGGMSPLDDRLAWVASNRPPDNLQYSGSIGTSTGWNVFMFPILLYSIIENTTAIAPTFLWRMFIGFCLFVTRKKEKKIVVYLAHTPMRCIGLVDVPPHPLYFSHIH